MLFLFYIIWCHCTTWSGLLNHGFKNLLTRFIVNANFCTLYMMLFSFSDSCIQNNFRKIRVSHFTPFQTKQMLISKRRPQDSNNANISLLKLFNASVKTNTFTKKVKNKLPLTYTYYHANIRQGTYSKQHPRNRILGWIGFTHGLKLWLLCEQFRNTCTSWVIVTNITANVSEYEDSHLLASGLVWHVQHNTWNYHLYLCGTHRSATLLKPAAGRSKQRCSRTLFWCGEKKTCNVIVEVTSWV